MTRPLGPERVGQRVVLKTMKSRAGSDEVRLDDHAPGADSTRKLRSDSGADSTHKRTSPNLEKWPLRACGVQSRSRDWAMPNS